jgi:hypothetical protein
LRLARADTPTPPSVPSPLDGALYVAYREKLSRQSAHDICVRRFGFACSPDNSKYTNLELVLQTTAYRDLPGALPRNLKVHNLCRDPLGIPTRLLQVLGLGLGFCVSLRRNPDENPIDLERLRQDIRTRCAIGSDSNPDYDPKLYVKNPLWKPAPATPAIERALDSFASETATLFRHNRSGLHLYNLSPSDLHGLRKLKKDLAYCVTATDKNLGVAILEMSLMVERALSDHLLDTSNYLELTEESAQGINEASFRLILRSMVDDRRNLDPSTIQFFTRTLCTRRDAYGRVIQPEHLHLPYFYILPKVHKNPWKTRPVVSAVSSVPESLSKWIDLHLQQVIHLCPAYLRDTWQLLRDLRALGNIPLDTVVYTADAVSMYTNINTDHALEVFQLWFDLHSLELPPGYPVSKILDGLSLIMRRNVFSFGNRYFHQVNGTAMGTPCACAYATIYYSYHEETSLLVPGTHGLLFYRRLIDDALIFQRHTADGWTRFIESMDDFGPPGKRLKWESEDGPGRSAHFLDLEIHLQDDGSIQTRTYQKDMNLYLYRPPTSAQPDSILYGLIYGTLHRYFWQNSDRSWFDHFVGLFYKRLQDRGHCASNLARLFIRAASRVDISALPTPKSKRQTLDALNNSIYIHLRYHPQDPSRQELQKLFQSTCRSALDEAYVPSGTSSGQPVAFGRSVIAYSRAPNIADLVRRNRLGPDFDTTNVSGPSL